MNLEIGQEICLSTLSGDRFNCLRIVEQSSFFNSNTIKKPCIFLITPWQQLLELVLTIDINDKTDYNDKGIVSEVFPLETLLKLKTKQSKYLTLYYTNNKVITYELIDNNITQCIDCIRQAMATINTESIVKSKLSPKPESNQLIDSYFKVIKSLIAEFTLTPSMDIINDIMNLLKQTCELTNGSYISTSETKTKGQNYDQKHIVIVQYVQQFLQRDDVIQVLNNHTSHSTSTSNPKTKGHNSDLPQSRRTSLIIDELFPPTSLTPQDGGVNPPEINSTSDVIAYQSPQDDDFKDDFTSPATARSHSDNTFVSICDDRVTAILALSSEKGHNSDRSSPIKQLLLSTSSIPPFSFPSSSSSAGAAVATAALVAERDEENDELGDVSPRLAHELSQQSTNTTNLINNSNSLNSNSKSTDEEEAEFQRALQQISQEFDEITSTFKYTSPIKSGTSEEEDKEDER